MEPRSFDRLARSLAAPRTRRGLLGSLAALSAGLFGARAADADAQVTQRDCGNVICASNPGACAAGCVCCVFGNGNSRCMPPSKCTGNGTVVTTTTTPAPTTTTTTTPAPCAGLNTGDPCGTNGVCLDGRCFLAAANCEPADRGHVANTSDVFACLCGNGSFALCNATSECAAPDEWCHRYTLDGDTFQQACRTGCLV